MGAATRSTVTTGRGAPPRGAHATESALQRLGPLLDAAARLELADREGWAQLRAAARPRLAVLRTGGLLPDHLAIAVDDPPSVVSRTLLAAWRHLVR